MGNRLGQALPLAGFGRQLFPSGGSQTIVPGAAVILRRAPLGGDQPPSLQRRRERAMVHPQHVLRGPLDGFGHGVAVNRAEQQGSQDQQVERALQHVDRFVFLFSHKAL